MWQGMLEDCKSTTAYISYILESAWTPEMNVHYSTIDKT